MSRKTSTCKHLRRTYVVREATPPMHFDARRQLLVSGVFTKEI